MKNKNRFSKPVAFNSNNAEDQCILKHVSRRNFSGYVKKLILADIKGREDLKPQNEPIKEVLEHEPKELVKEVEKVLTAAEKMAQMKEKLKNPSKAPGPKMFS